MIIYGTRATPLKSVHLPNETCPKCNTKGAFVASVFNRYAHIFWLPTFPIGRRGAVICTTCNYIFEDKHIPQSLKMHYDQVYSQTRVPIWSWSGLAIILGLIAFASYSADVDKENEQKYVTNPMIGDVYSVKLDDGNYSLMKVSSVSPDSVMVHLNTYTVDKSSGIYQLRSKDYDTIGYWISREHIKSMYADKDIIGIDR